MITFSLLGKYGRLGNQFFQISAVIGIALANHQPYMFPPWQYEDLMINRFPLDYNLMSPYVIINEVWPYVGIPAIKVGHFDLQGYFQSYKYFNHVTNIKDTFRFNVETNDDTDRVAIHVRRGDYLGHQNIHPIPPFEYYRRAMNLFPNENFSIFSDDIDWCKDTFINYNNVVYILPGDPLTDLLYMSKHKAVITANSSFSWWGGYLCNGPVVCPKVWALNEPIECMGDRIPPDWNIIQYD